MLRFWLPYYFVRLVLMCLAAGKVIVGVTMIVLVVTGRLSMDEPSKPARLAAFVMIDWTVTVFMGRES